MFPAHDIATAREVFLVLDRSRWKLTSFSVVRCLSHTELSLRSFQSSAEVLHSAMHGAYKKEIKQKLTNARAGSIPAMHWKHSLLWRVSASFVNA